MTKRQTRAFCYAVTGLFTLVFIGLTFDSHRQFDRLTNSDKITAEVTEGKHVWHRKNCINCHTLLGEGAYYAPDLTKITKLRGREYLTSFLEDPSRFYSENQHRRLMPNPKLKGEEIQQVIAFLEWVSNIDTQGWPPRPILVTGSAIPGLTALTERETPASSDPIAVGTELFQDPQIGCFACHSTAPGVNMVGPTMAGVLSRARTTIADPSYGGQAKTPEDYLRESIDDPSRYLVPGPTFSSEGRSLMPAHFQDKLSPEQREALVAYLATLK
jgi:nitric oxide reductase subunit C